MNLILLQAEDFIGGDRVEFDDDRARHIHQVLQPELGDRLRCGLLGGLIGDGEVIQLQPRVQLRVSLNTPAPAKLPLTLLLALPRPKAARRIIRSATELGVAEIIVLNSYRVEKSYWQSPLVDGAHLQAAMLEGLEQCGDTVLPRLSRARLFKPFVEDQLPALLSQRRGFLAHPYAHASLADLAPDPQQQSLLVIGPEGGFIPYEVEKLAEAGCQGFSLGPRILKVETAVPALIAKLFP